MGDEQISLEEWLEEWAEEVSEGRSHISRAEATRRYYQRYPKDEE